MSLNFNRRSIFPPIAGPPAHQQSARPGAVLQGPLEKDAAYAPMCPTRHLQTYRLGYLGLVVAANRKLLSPTPPSSVRLDLIQLFVCKPFFEYVH